MTMLEALQRLIDERNLHIHWARPILWRGLKWAIIFNAATGAFENNLLKGGYVHLPSIEEMTCTWELVSPLDVNEGR